jgi:hypothetical protein
MVRECDALDNLEIHTIFCWKIEMKDVVDCYTLIPSRFNWGLGVRCTLYSLSKL